MEHFEINIEHRGTAKTFQGTFAKFGYSYRFTINVEGTEVIFEPDEERNFRAVVLPGIQDDAKIKEIVKLIGQELREKLQ